MFIFKNKKKNNKEKGVSLYIAVVITSILLAIVLGISAILVGQIKIIRGMENSVLALYAAETGIERALMERADPSLLDGSGDVMDNGAGYQLTIFSSGAGGCSADNFCVKSVGSYSGVKRAIEIEY